MTSKSEDTSTSVTRHVEFEASIFSALESNLSSPLSLNLPHPGRIDVKHTHEKRRSRHDTTPDSKRRGRQDPKPPASPRSLHRSSSIVFRTLPPLRLLPSLQVPSLTDITSPHALSTPRRSLHQISETQATTYKLKLPLTVVHPNSPYVPWEAPVREQILCPLPLESRKDEREGSAEQEGSATSLESEGKVLSGDNKPVKRIWTRLKSAPQKVRSRCQRLLNTRKDSPGPTNTAFEDSEDESCSPGFDSKEQVITYTLDNAHAARPYSPTASFLSTDTNTLAIWLAERQRKFIERDCESAKIMSIEEYERLGSQGWNGRAGEFPFSSRSSYHCSFVDGDGISSTFVSESQHDLTGSSPSEQMSIHRAGHGHKREEERLSRIVHRTSVRSYIAERSSPSICNGAWAGA